MTGQQEPELTRLQQWGRSPTTWRFWVGAVLVVGLLVGGCLAGLVLIQRDTDATVVELNDRYVEEIDIESVAVGNNRTRDVVVIDGVRREDCDEDDAALTCSEDPQPTEE